jgi:S1-C subfamily serine protease
MNQDGDLVGLCSNSVRENFVAFGNLDVLQRALAGWAGLRDDDIIIAIGAVPITDGATLVAALAGLMPGDSVELTVRGANGDETTLVFPLGKTAADQP